MKIEDHIIREANRLIRRHEGRIMGARLESKARQERSTKDLESLESHDPSWWAVDSGFDPYHAKKNAAAIGDSIWKSLQAGSYAPRPPVLQSVPKGDGTFRTVSIFQVADSAVSKMVFESVLAKNSSRMSGSSYAYRRDLSAQDAVLTVKNAWSEKQRVFIAEFDFSAFFDSISHDHIERVLDERTMFLSRHELDVLRAFMPLKPALASDYPGKPLDNRRGIPQGTSVSLILANLAASELDRNLERLGLQFVRYADDTLIWSDSYDLVCQAFNVLNEAASRMGVSLNQAKSDGISLLVPANWPNGEIRTKRVVQFLGYDLGLGSCKPSKRARKKIQSDCAGMIYDHLLREPMRGCQNLDRIAANVDKDYVRLLSQLRRYLYGDLNEKQVRSFQRGEIKLRHFRGALSAYPLIDDGDYLSELDGWLLQTIHSALHKRRKLLESRVVSFPTPHHLSIDKLVTARFRSSSGHSPSLAIPSFRRISRAIGRAADTYGPAAVGSEPNIGTSNAFDHTVDKVFNA